VSVLTTQAARRQWVVLLAIFIGAALGALLGAFALVIVNPIALGLIEEKSISLRYHLVELLPHPAEPQFVPTPFAISAVTPSPTFAPSNGPTTQPPNHPTPQLPARTPAPPARVTPIQLSVALHGVRHDYQRWNNCGPTTLEMALSYFGRTDTQAEIAAFTKPNPDDRNVRPNELAAYVSRTGLRSIIRVDGTLDLLKTFLSNGLPVIVETALVKEPQGWMGHYRLLVGYDAKQFNTMDSYDGPHVQISFGALDADWLAFNRVYLVIYPPAQEARVRAILGDALDDQTMYTQAVARARAEIQAHPNDAFAEFDLGSSLNGLKRYSEAAAAFDRARILGLPWRMLWYQFGPYEAYLQTGRYNEVIALTDALLQATDDLEESHYYKGLALRALGRTADARREFQAALKWNPNYRDAQRALAGQ
jgi:Peptidase_C39 like family/Tetratricopeptide repeat